LNGNTSPSPLQKRGRKEEKVSGNRDFFLSPYGRGLRGRRSNY